MQFGKKSRPITMLLLLVAQCTHAQAPRPSTPAVNKPAAVTAVTGESWLTHLNRPFSETSMGKTWRLGPAPTSPETSLPLQPDLPAKAASQVVTLHGSDLYRMNCQGCHGESGAGVPPEINSVINPVRASSVEMIMARLKTTGMEISRGDAIRLAQQSKAALLQRLHNGGENMPPFPHLDEAEVNSLLAYLNQLAAVPSAQRQQLAVQKSRLHVGEHIVKSTCHTCHAAAGPDPDPQQIWNGAIPPLSTLTTRKSQAEFIRKVTHGAPVLMGASPMLYRGRMPVFYYLSEDEAADAYLYLSLYPPARSAGVETIAAITQSGSARGGLPPVNGRASFVPETLAAQPQSRGSGRRTVLLLTGIGSFVFLLLAGGLGFTIHEFQRLATAKPKNGITEKTQPARRTKDATPRLQRVS